MTAPEHTGPHQTRGRHSARGRVTTTFRLAGASRADGREDRDVDQALLRRRRRLRGRFRRGRRGRVRGWRWRRVRRRRACGRRGRPSSRTWRGLWRRGGRCGRTSGRRCQAWIRRAGATTSASGSRPIWRRAARRDSARRRGRDGAARTRSRTSARKRFAGRYRTCDLASRHGHRRCRNGPRRTGSGCRRDCRGEDAGHHQRDGQTEADADGGLSIQGVDAAADADPVDPSEAASMRCTADRSPPDGRPARPVTTPEDTEPHQTAWLLAPSWRDHNHVSACTAVYGVVRRRAR